MGSEVRLRVPDQAMPDYFPKIIMPALIARNPAVSWRPCART
jgi:hypothetical protein